MNLDLGQPEHLADPHVLRLGGDETSIDDLISFFEKMRNRLNATSGGLTSFRYTLFDIARLKVACGHIDTAVVRWTDEERSFGFEHATARRMWEWLSTYWVAEDTLSAIMERESERYFQATPQRRVLSYLRALRDGDERRPGDEEMS